MELEVIPWAEDAPPNEAELERRLAGDGFEAFLWRDGPGARYPDHQHDRDESLWLLRGGLCFTISGERHALGPGDRLLLPAGTVHAALAGPDGATYLIGRR